MSEQLRESLSAAMDGEADAFELRRVLDEASNDEALREQWHRLHVMRDLMQDARLKFDPALRDNVRAALQEPPSEDEEVTGLVLADAASERAPMRSPWLARLGGTAVAAAVALVVMVNGGVFDEEAPAEFADNQFSTPEFASVQSQAALAVEPVLYQDATDVDKQRQNALMLHHIQQRAMNQASMTSFVKLATFNNTETAPTAGDQNRRP